MNLRELARERPAEGGVAAVRRNVARETWGWLWPDTLRRLVPFGAAALVYARWRARGGEDIGLAPRHPARDVALGAAVGIPMVGVAAAFRAWAVPGYRLPTAGDQALQTFFYLAMNAPVEEIFWRGMVQNEATRAAECALGGAGARAAAVGWLVATGTFGIFHSFGGNWNWRSVLGATAAGGVFGLTYLLQPRPRSLWPSVIVHGLTTAGFLSWGDVALHWRALRRAKALGRG